MANDEQPYWKFTQYPLAGDKGAIDKWRGKLDGHAEVEFETVVKTLSSIKNKLLWGPPEYKVMASWNGIGEIRFENAAGKPMRVFGFFRDEQQEFVMLAGGTHDGKKYDPSNIRDICIGRKKNIELGRDISIDFDFEYEDEEEDEDEYIRNLFR